MKYKIGDTLFKDPYHYRIYAIMHGRYFFKVMEDNAYTNADIPAVEADPYCKLLLNYNDILKEML